MLKKNTDIWVFNHISSERISSVPQHSRCLFWKTGFRNLSNVRLMPYWKNGDLINFFENGRKEVAGGPFTEETKTSPTASSLRQDRTAACQIATRTTNLRSAALPQKRCLVHSPSLKKSSSISVSICCLTPNGFLAAGQKKYCRRSNSVVREEIRSRMLRMLASAGTGCQQLRRSFFVVHFQFCIY